MDLYLDGQPLVLAETTDFKSFEELCSKCSNHLQEDGRAIRAISMDGVEVDCNNPPSVYELMSAKRVEISSCLLNELVGAALRHQHETAQPLVARVMDLSTDCLIEMPQETFGKWKEVLESLKALVGFTPHFFAIQSAVHGTAEEGFESALMTHGRAIPDTVDDARRALDAQDIVQFSDILELRIVAWLKKHVELCQQVAGGLTK